MKKVISVLIFVLLVCMVSMPVSAATDESSSVSETEAYLDELIEIFPEANLNKELLLTENSVMPLSTERSVVNTYSKTIGGDKYELTVYNDNSLFVLKEYEEVEVADSTYERLFEASSVISGQITSFLYMRVYYYYVGVYEAPEISSITTSSSYTTILGSHYDRYSAGVNGNVYYENIVVDLWGAEFIQKVYYAGLYIEIESVKGHEFKVDSGRVTQY